MKCLTGAAAGVQNLVRAAAGEALPKAEVHVHLEGSFSAPDVAQLARDPGA